MWSRHSLRWYLRLGTPERGDGFAVGDAALSSMTLSPGRRLELAEPDGDAALSLLTLSNCGAIFSYFRGMNSLRNIVLATMAVFACLHCPAQLGDRQAAPVEIGAHSPLYIFSWNIYMLPKFAKVTGKRQRAHLIAASMRKREDDILVFQEAFLGDARRIIGKALQTDFPYQYGPANRKFSIKTNSGIWVLSKVPLKVLEEIDYVECEGFDDCFARKGALLLSGEHGGQAFQILGTHLQAGGPQAIRAGQLREIRGLLDRHKVEGVPQIIAGDMNTGHSDTADYRDMVRILDAQDGPLDIQLPTVEGGYPNDLHSHGVRSFRVIDFIFYRGNGVAASTIERNMPSLTTRWSRKHQDLSDHFPVEMVVGW